MTELIAPNSNRPGIIPVYFSRVQLLRLLELLKDCKGDDAVIRHIILRDLKICLMLDIEAIPNSSQVGKYQELLNKLNEDKSLHCKNCVHISENIAAGTYEVFCSSPNTFFEEHQFTTKDNWANECDFYSDTED